VGKKLGHQEKGQTIMESRSYLRGHDRHKKWETLVGKRGKKVALSFPWPKKKESSTKRKTTDGDQRSTRNKGKNAQVSAEKKTGLGK